MDTPAQRLQAIARILARGVVRTCSVNSSPTPPPADGAPQGDTAPPDAGDDVAGPSERGTPGYLTTSLYKEVAGQSRACSSLERAPSRDCERSERHGARTPLISNDNATVLPHSHPDGGGGAGEEQARREGEDR